MSRLSYGRWECTPGSFDVTRAFQVFPSNNDLGIPDLQPFTGEVPDFFIPWNDRVRSDRKLSRSARHFFLDDYRFESLWNMPGRYNQRIRECGAVLSPDFSLWVDQPKATQIWNTFRNRWLGVLWQREGVPVIPTVTWAEPASYEFCFQGLPKGSIVAVSTVGCIRSKDARDLFVAGYKEMLNVLEPKRVLIYGKPIEEVSGLATAYHFPTRWEKRSR